MRMWDENIRDYRGEFPRWYKIPRNTAAISCRIPEIRNTEDIRRTEDHDGNQQFAISQTHLIFPKMLRNTVNTFLLCLPERVI